MGKRRSMRNKGGGNSEGKITGERKMKEEETLRKGNGRRERKGEERGRIKIGAKNKPMRE